MQFTVRSKSKKHGLLLDGPVDDDERCKNCDGACCRSFQNVALSWDEYERLRNLGAIRLDFSLMGHYSLIIENGCEFLAAGRCTIYQDRPDVCRRFFCRDE